MPRFNRSHNGRANGSRNKGGNSQRIVKPPQLRSNVQLSHTYRFVSTSGTATAVTNGSIIAASGNVCVVANSIVATMFQSFKITGLKVWSPPASQGAAVTCSVEWTGSPNSPNVERSDSTVSVAVPAHIHGPPPPMSLASFWQPVVVGSGTVTMFILTAPVGSIIDLSVDLILCDDEASTPFQTSVTTGVLSTIYYLSLDPNATHRYTPVSLTTTT